MRVNSIGNSALSSSGTKNLTNFKSRLVVDSEISRNIRPLEQSKIDNDIIPVIKALGDKFTKITLTLLNLGTRENPYSMVRRTVSNSACGPETLETVYRVKHVGTDSYLPLIETALKDFDSGDYSQSKYIKDSKYERDIKEYMRQESYVQPKYIRNGAEIVMNSNYRSCPKPAYSSLDQALEVHVENLCANKPIESKFLYYRAPIDADNNTRVHYASDKALEAMHETLKNSSELLKAIHLTANDKQELPIHTLSKSGRRTVLQAFKDNPDFLAKLYTYNPSKFSKPALNIEGGSIESKLWNIQEEVLMILRNGQLSNDSAIELSEKFKNNAEIDFINKMCVQSREVTA